MLKQIKNIACNLFRRFLRSRGKLQICKDRKTGHINLHYTSTKKLTIFLHHGTQSEFKKANEVGKYLWENFGIKPNFFVLHCFLQYIDASNVQYTADLGFINKWSINKIITTNSTGILPVQDNERLQVIDCFDIFQDCLKENN